VVCIWNVSRKWVWNCPVRTFQWAINLASEMNIVYLQVQILRTHGFAGRFAHENDIMGAKLCYSVVT